MRKIFTAAILSALSTSLFAHDYQTVYSHRTALFANTNNQVKCMQIDSTKTSLQDSVLYPMKNIRSLTAGNYTPYGNSWLGAKVIIRNGWNLFVNQQGDTIRINTAAKAGESWRVLYKPTLSVDAIVTKIELLTFMGLTDSVKTITFTAQLPICTCAPQKIVAEISAELDGKSIQISKHYGLLKSFNFDAFPYPDDRTTTYSSTWEQYSLIGLTNPKVGVQNLTWFDVFDFQPGDEIHTIISSTPMLGSPPQSDFVYSYEIITKYLARHDYNDSIVYQKDVTELTNRINYKHYTSTETIYQYQSFNNLPERVVIENGVANYYTMSCGTFIAKNFPTISTEIYKGNDDWHQIISEACDYSSYYKGLGGPYYSWSGLFGVSEERKLVYYKKGTTSWGVPMVINDVKQLNEASEPVVYPNPTTGFVSINADFLQKSGKFCVLDLSGKLVLEVGVSGVQQTINLSNIEKGLYVYKIIVDGNALKVGKITKM